MGGMSIPVNTIYSPQGITIGAAGPIPADWFDTDFLCRVAITIQGSQVLPAGGQTDFPFLFNSIVEDFKTKPLPTGTDFRFALTNKNEIPFEIEEYDRVNGRLVAWTKLNVFDGLKFYVYYNNPAAITNVQNPAAVWSDYVAVYHLNQTTFGVNDTVDSTGNGHDGSTVNMDLATNQKPGQIDGSLLFNVDDTEFSLILDDNALDPGTGPWSVSAWINEDDTGRMDFVGKSRDGGAFDGWAFRTNGVAGNNRPLFTMRGASGKALIVQTTNETISVSTQHLLAFTYPGGSLNASAAKIFVDGVDEPLDIIDNTLDVAVSTDVLLNIGDTGGTLPSFRLWDGLIDEVHISADVKTPDFITTEFNNQDAPETFYNLVAPQCLEELYLLQDEQKYKLQDGDNYLLSEAV